MSNRDVTLVRTAFDGVEPGEDYLVQVDAGAWLVMRGSVNGRLMWPDGCEAERPEIYPHIYLIRQRSSEDAEAMLADYEAMLD